MLCYSRPEFALLSVTHYNNFILKGKALQVIFKGLVDPNEDPNVKVKQLRSNS